MSEPQKSMISWEPYCAPILWKWPLYSLIGTRLTLPWPELVGPGVDTWPWSGSGQFICLISNSADFLWKFEMRRGNWSKLFLGPWPKRWVRVEKKTEVSFAVCLFPSCPDCALILRPGWETGRRTVFETGERDCWTCTPSQGCSDFAGWPWET